MLEHRVEQIRFSPHALALTAAARGPAATAMARTTKDLRRLVRDDLSTEHRQSPPLLLVPSAAQAVKRRLCSLIRPEWAVRWRPRSGPGSAHGVHDLRNTHAGLLLKAGTPPHVVSQRLGHSTVAFTLQVYAHSRASSVRPPMRSRPRCSPTYLSWSAARAKCVALTPS